MIVISPQAAKDEMFGRFLATWKLTFTITIVGYMPIIFWQGKLEPFKPDYSKYFCRVSKQTVLESQSSLSTQCGLPGQKRFTVDGLLFIQIFCPISDPKADERGRALATIARDTYRDNVAGDSIVYRRQRIQDLDPEEQCLRFNVVTEYQYDELG